MKFLSFLVVSLMFGLVVTGRAADGPPLKGGERILFIGNSLTARLPTSLNDMAEANGLPRFEGHRLQLWAETLETHVKLSREATPQKFTDKPNREAGMKGYAVSAAYTSLWKQGQYDTPEFNERGYITALDAIARGTPEGKPWDYVVIQAYGDANDAKNRITIGPDGKPVFEGPLMIYGSKLIEATKAAGAKPILYMAWLLNPEQGGGVENPTSYYNQNFDRLIANYTALGKAHNVPVVPVGAAMRVLSKERKPAEARTAWLIRDNVHGTVCGSALLHYCMASALWGKPATELKFETSRKANAPAAQGEAEDRYAIGATEKKYGLTITPEINRTIQEVAEECMKAYGWR